MAEILSGGLTWGSIQQAIVTMDKEGHPLTCCNPVTGECLGGGGSSDFSTAKVTISESSTAGIHLPIIRELPAFGEVLLVENFSAISASGIFDVALYKLKALCAIPAGIVVTVDSGNASVVPGSLVIEGDCTLTITEEQ